MTHSRLSTVLDPSLIETSFFQQIKDRLVEFDYLEEKFSDDSIPVEDIIKDLYIINCSLYPKIIAISKKRMVNQTMISFIDRERREMMRQLRENFKFIGGARNKS